MEGVNILEFCINSRKIKINIRTIFAMTFVFLLILPWNMGSLILIINLTLFAHCACFLICRHAYAVYLFT